MLKHLNIRISGRVQGVFFRDSAKKEARKLGLAGFARNEPDGTVYVEAEGEEARIHKFLEWCQSGPVAARVEKTEVKEGVLRNFSDFSVL